ncbi:MAG: Maf family nucleotide pyrophosphatase [Xanthomonadaceae bacterium]|nr:Maf family nucleotide pyrophosphatase [Xanthomonadaceae bacterium]MDP2183995.1 Maf family nucleotide pyrophosphatase [Xanthomonadales bacterium]MDZ4116003.1 Maf family nucleotide pyrophosphatase [Xanthomonadaceae bacterium]MDZ4376782.1 Maf family nucleotide pyrophosphatase [Xanthomonadaceae bacterium]
MPRLILASTSAYRRELLARLRLPFDVVQPDVDETALPGEPASERAQRLAKAKSQIIAQRQPDAWVIGSDQVAQCADSVLDKPGSSERAHTQLRAASGRELRFHTALCLSHAASTACWQALDITHAQLRTLSDAEISRYIAAEQALDCAGSFKAEGLGISLFEHIRSDDPTALIGLPLIALCQLLRRAGFELP